MNPLKQRPQAPRGVALGALAMIFGLGFAQPSNAADIVRLSAQDKTDAASALARARSAEAIEGAARLQRNEASHAPGRVNFAGAVRAGTFETNPAARAAISQILSRPLSEKGKPNPSRCKAVREIVEALIAQPDLPHRALLETIYGNGYKADDLQQWAEAEELTRLLHPLMYKIGVTEQSDYSRSTAYKRLLRRQRVLIETRK